MPDVGGIARARARRRAGSPPGSARRPAPAPDERPGSVSSSAAAASFDATSPACAPPMPSATAKSGGATTYESSLRRRFLPVSLARAYAPTLIPRTSARSRRRARRRRSTSFRGRSMRTPFTNVPFVEPRSCTQTPSRRGSMRTWRADANSSAVDHDVVLAAAPDRERRRRRARTRVPARGRRSA